MQRTVIGYKIVYLVVLFSLSSGCNNQRANIGQAESKWTRLAVKFFHDTTAAPIINENGVVEARRMPRQGLLLEAVADLARVESEKNPRQSEVHYVISAMGSNLPLTGGGVIFRGKTKIIIHGYFAEDSSQATIIRVSFSERIFEPVSIQFASWTGTEWLVSTERAGFTVGP